MTTRFTFVSVQLNEDNVKSRSRKRAIAAKDSAKIRSLAATSSWNRQLPNEDDTAWNKRKAMARNLRKSMRYAMARTASDYPESDSSPEAEESVSNSDSESQCLGYSSELSDDDFEFVETYLPPGAAKNRADEEDVIRNYPHIANTLLNIREIMPFHLKSGRLDPFWTFNIPYRPFLSRVLHHRLTTLSPVIPEIEALLGGNGNIMFMTHHGHEPAYMFADCAVSAAHLYLVGGKQSSNNDPAEAIRKEDILWLKGCALSYLNRLLDRGNLTDQESNCAIASIINLGLYERGFGNPDLYTVHMEAVRRMFAQRGGINTMNKLFDVMFKYMWNQAAALESLVAPTARLEDNTPDKDARVSYQHIFAISSQFAKAVMSPESENQSSHAVSEIFP